MLELSCPCRWDHGCMLPIAISAENSRRANALEGSSFGLASLIGASLAGLAIATVGPAWVIAADACSYLVFALALTSARTALRHPATMAQPRARRAAGYGFRHLIRTVVRPRLTASRGRCKSVTESDI